MNLAREKEAEVEIEKINFSKLRKEFDKNNNTVETEDFTDTKDQNQIARIESNESVVFRNFDCSNCTQSFHNLEDLIAHFEANQSEALSLEPNFPCVFCGREFEALAQLIGHIRTLHRLPTSAETRAFIQEVQKIKRQTVSEAVATIESDLDMI